MTALGAGLLNLFSLVFSVRWIHQWQKERRQDASKARKRARNAGGKEKKPARFYDRVYSLQVTLWCMIFQRLSSDRTLDQVIKELRGGGADHLSGGRKKISRRIRSRSTSAYSQARRRLPEEFLRAALERMRRSLLKLVGGEVRDPKTAPPPGQRSRQILDGSTLCALSTPALREAYPPARNGRSVSDWCLIRVVVGFCARSGAVLSAVEGPITRSEQALSWVVMQAAQAFTIWIGDRNFGVWSVVSQARRCQQDVLVRLTGARARKLAGGVALRSGEDRAVCWHPSRHDQGAPGVEREGVSGRLMYVRLQRAGGWIDLHLFTTLDARDYPLELLVEWYGQRWQAELNFRYLKTQMEMEQLQVSSPEMARKEFLAGMLAYNLVRAVMWGAGARLDARKEEFSFSGARRTLVEWLKEWGRRRLRGRAGSRIRRLLREIMGDRLPSRRKARPNEIRRQRHRSQKFPPLRGDRAQARLAFAAGARPVAAKPLQTIRKS